MFITNLYVIVMIVYPKE